MTSVKNYEFIDQVTSSGILIAKVWGDFGMESVLELLRDLYAIECEYPQGFRRFTDLGLIQSLNLSSEEVRIITAKRRADYNGPAVRSAIFARDPMAFGILRLYMSMLEPSPIDVNVFYTMEESADWIGVTLEEIMPLGETDH